MTVCPENCPEGNGGPTLIAGETENKYSHLYTIICSPRKRQSEKMGALALGRRPCSESSMKGDVLHWSKWIVLLTTLTFIAWVGAIAGAADAKVYLDIYGQSYRKISIAVPPLMSGEKERSEISDLLGQDLDMSGFFTVAPRSMIDKEFLSEGVDRESIRFDQWHLSGWISCARPRWRKMRMVSLFSRIFMTWETVLSSSQRNLKRLLRIGGEQVHRLADEIILQATGEKGIMSQGSSSWQGKEMFTSLTSTATGQGI